MNAEAAVVRATITATEPASCRNCRLSRPTAHGSIYCTQPRSPMRGLEETHEQIAARCKYYQEER